MRLIREVSFYEPRYGCLKNCGRELLDSLALVDAVRVTATYPREQVYALLRLAANPIQPRSDHIGLNTSKSQTEPLEIVPT